MSPARTLRSRPVNPVLLALRDWGDQYMAPDGPPVHYRHRNCGGEAHAHLSCDTCHQELTARDVTPEAGPGMKARPGKSRRATTT
jgi:hypothetical protein